jgi:fumarate reductase subunit D
VFVLPLEYLKQAGAVYGFLIILSVLAAICMPPYVAFLLTPIRGQQKKIKWFIYGLAAILFVVQLIVM